MGTNSATRSQLLSAIAVITVLGGCGSVDVPSARRRVDITADGNAEEWRGDLEYVEKIVADIGAVNDDSTLSLCFILRDENLSRRIAFSGMNLWIDPGGGKEKRFGIAFPLGFGPRQRGMRDQQAGRRGEPGTSEEQGADAGDSGAGDVQPPHSGHDWEQRLRTDDLEFLGDASVAPTPVPAANVADVHVGVSVSRSHALIYEITLPLARDAAHPHGIGARPGAPIGIGIEVPALRLPAGNARGEGRGPGGSGDEPGEGGRGGWGGRGGGGRGHRGMGGGPPGGALDAWEAWARVKLAPAS